MTGHAMIDLPVELVQEIVLALATPPYPLQYGHAPQVKHALCQLALVNRFLSSLATPHLYASVVIASTHELRAFLSTSPLLRGHSTSLWLRSFPGMFPLIADLLYDLGPHLRRLALDIPENELGPVRDALRLCIHLEDFTRSGYSPMQIVQPRSFWPSWTSLRRLVLDGPLVDDSFIHSVAKLPNLAHLALIEPRWRYSVDGTEIATFLSLLDAGVSLQRILLIYCDGTEFYMNSLRRLRTTVKLRGLQPGLNILYMVIREREPNAPMTRIRSQIGDGTLWDLHSRNLLGAPMGLW
ncbi:hypothetical protein DXG03_007751 [Asterophora parasitica]|uniref:Uncharacterized protein n=1 Tax=Asterophora parasitica TaxID=117018 RepID=A0A9P7GIT8_9AGAR|nr:hypothetical protein DXG03_007751 [Asterophora parasitica]